MTTRCVNRLSPIIVLGDVTPEEANNYIREHCPEYYEIPPGFIIRNVRILGKSPILLGIRKKGRKSFFPSQNPVSEHPC
jgi:hypothetical protein